jgi:hypothetical protein
MLAERAVFILLREVDKLGAVRALGLPAELFTDASEKLVERGGPGRSAPTGWAPTSGAG